MESSDDSSSTSKKALIALFFVLVHGDCMLAKYLAFDFKTKQKSMTHKWMTQ